MFKDRIMAANAKFEVHKIEGPPGTMYRTLVEGLFFWAHALSACVGRLGSLVCAFGGFLLSFLVAYACLTIACLCNTPPGTLRQQGL